jgi:hypothetical protein
MIKMGYDYGECFICRQITNKKNVFENAANGRICLDCTKSYNMEIYFELDDMKKYLVRRADCFICKKICPKVWSVSLCHDHEGIEISDNESPDPYDSED